MFRFELHFLEILFTFPPPCPVAFVLRFSRVVSAGFPSQWKQGHLRYSTEMMPAVKGGYFWLQIGPAILRGSMLNFTIISPCIGQADFFVKEMHEDKLKCREIYHNMRYMCVCMYIYIYVYIHAMIWV